MPNKPKPPFAPILTASPLTRRLFELAHEQDMSDVEIGLAIDRNNNTIGAWRRGERSMTVIDAECLADALGVSLAFGGDNA